MTMQIGGHELPLTMADLGKLDPVLREHKPLISGLRQTLPGLMLSWKFDVLTQDEYLWWTQTLLDGEMSKEFSTASLPSIDGQLVDYAYAQVRIPFPESMSHSLYYGVKVEIRLR